MRPQQRLTIKHVLLLCFCAILCVKAIEVEDFLYQATFDQLLQSGELDLHFDDEHDVLSASPWSYQPLCTKYLPQLNSKLCVYTNTGFSNGRGISIFTTPQIADDFTSVLSSADKTLPEGINTVSETWYTKEVPSKGIGMLAKHDLNRGDVITAYTPVLLAYKENILSKAEREKFLGLAVNALPALSREGYDGLATMYHDPKILMQDIASANSFEMVLKGTAHLAVIPESSRFNHDCAPNAIFLVNATSLTHTVRATRPIKKDEEITIAYTNPLDPFATRQKYLSNSFGFKCTCPRCHRGEAGDDALAEITFLQQSLSNWADPTSTASTKQAERLIQIHQEEGLDGYLDPAYCLAALMYNSVGSERGARKYVKLCIEGIKLRLGTGAEDLPRWKEIFKDPTSHWSWMRRKRG